VVIQQNSRKLVIMDILMSEACWAHKKWNKIASDIKLVFYSSAVTMMHGRINVSYPSSWGFSTPFRKLGLFRRELVKVTAKWHSGNALRLTTAAVFSNVCFVGECTCEICQQCYSRGSSSGLYKLYVPMVSTCKTLSRSSRSAHSLKNNVSDSENGRSRWPRGVRLVLRPFACWGLRVRIPLGTWMSLVSVLCFLSS